MLFRSDIDTVEKLGYMTPEDLEALPGIEPQMVEAIQQAVNSYYSQFEEQQPAEVPAEVEAVTSEAAAETQQAAANETELPQAEVQAVEPVDELVDHTPAAEKSVEGTEGVQS